MRTDFENLQDGQEITLYPSELNPITRSRHRVIHQNGYYFIEGEHEPAYYFGDVAEFNNGFNIVD